MARHYSSRSFFRQIPNVLLARCFKDRGLFGELDFTAMRETRPDELLKAWLELPEKHRNALEVDFREIFEMSCEKGIRAILDEANWHWREDPDQLESFVEMFSSQPGHYHRAMITWLDHPECWRRAAQFYHSDSLPYWRKRKHLGHRVAAADPASLDQLADLIRSWFHRKEARGNHCIVETFRRRDLDYFFAYPEDYSQQQTEWVDGGFGRRPHNPAFEVVYVYSQLEGSLDLNFRGPYRAVEPLQGMFATPIVKLDCLPPDPGDNRVYDLDPLRRRDFEFLYDADSGIEDVAVRKLRLSSRVRRGDRITVEADACARSDAIYDVLEDTGRTTPLHLYSVTQAELLTLVVLDVEKPAKRVTILLTHPNSCKQLRKMLVEECLVAVVSLPTGVFQPYSGVKTSILILDKSLAKRANRIAFFKIDNDSFSLGAQRLPKEKNDLPQARAEVAEYMRLLRAVGSLDDFHPALGLLAEKEKIEANGEYNLSGERYREGTARDSYFQTVPLSTPIHKYGNVF